MAQMFPSRFIRAADLDGRPYTLTISGVQMEDLERDDGSERSAATVTFKEAKRQLVLNRTNALCIAAMFGDDTDGWLGKRITLYPERDTSPVNETGWCIRVKGSPDLSAPVTATIRLPRRKPQARKLIPTQTGAHEPVFDTETGEAPGPTGFDDITWTGES